MTALHAPHAPIPATPRKPSLLAYALLAVVRGYQILLSPIVGGTCRFEPSCSRYMAEAIERHGAGRGAWLGVRRLGRCHPFGSHGYDPVPPEKTTPLEKTTPGVISHPRSASEITPGVISQSRSV